MAGVPRNFLTGFLPRQTKNLGTAGLRSSCHRNTQLWFFILWNFLDKKILIFSTPVFSHFKNFLIYTPKSPFSTGISQNPYVPKEILKGLVKASEKT